MRIKITLLNDNENQFQLILSNINEYQIGFNTNTIRNNIDMTITNLSIENYISLVTTKSDTYKIENLDEPSFPVQTYNNMFLSHIKNNSGIQEWRLEFSNEEKGMSE